MRPFIAVICRKWVLEENNIKKTQRSRWDPRWIPGTWSQQPNVLRLKTSLTIYMAIHAPPSLTLTTGAPQGYVLIPALFCLHMYSPPTHTVNSLFHFAGVTPASTQLTQREPGSRGPAINVHIQSGFQPFSIGGVTAGGPKRAVSALTTMVRVCQWISRVYAGLFRARPSEYCGTSTCLCVAVSVCAVFCI